ncbi:similar to Saccharomyces cerevisiae YDR493W MZM1 Mitochondrial matrix protein with a role in maintaining the labile mitochondrial zinc pool [Geotrichum candidum]|uniref:Mitochondrial zinc maintenance protein 1, mitochondrial n=1 Tax=Geotrichum candidum TaxID=1173061 RepID=A0A0J9XBY1_GEOCN|nr:similar to Saccharomyces cerevisiae YDR493W MZM1 Mitochondrial matrix protein with a role in maintaining the labile mitochondrial zinc pool [Geotrichum candidum]
MSSVEAINTYRAILKACNRLFKGDEFRRVAAWTEVRRQYEEARNLTDPAAIAERLVIGKDVNTMLRKNVVQGTPSEKDPERYTLHIHEETELGDNEDIMKNSKRPTTNLSGTARCCSS